MPEMNGHVAEKLFTPLQVGNITLQHRIVLAPLTRYRADLEHVHHGKCHVFCRGSFALR